MLKLLELIQQSKKEEKENRTKETQNNECFLDLVSYTNFLLK